MTGILECLRQHPGSAHLSVHTGEVKKFMLDLGITNPFSHLKEGEHTQALHFGDHPTHWVLIAKFSGHEEEKENGYASFCAPKQIMSLDDFIFSTCQSLNLNPQTITSASIKRVVPLFPTN